MVLSRRTTCLLGILVLSGLATAPRTETGRRMPVGGHYIPIWAATQTAPILPTHSADPSAASTAVSTCPPPIVEFNVTLDVIAPHFDSTRMVTEIYVTSGGSVVRHDIDSLLNHTEVPVVSGLGGVWIAEDLDRDGDIELVAQAWDHLRIVSAPDWRVRGDFVWPGMAVAMHPTAVNIDDDDALEIYVTPNDFGVARADIIDFDVMADSFIIVADIGAPFMTRGHPAVGDFDEDGRVEFISANYYGYGLFEWKDSVLLYIGQASDVALGNDYYAITARPKPSGRLHALLGHADATWTGEYRYELLTAISDNVFEVVHIFSEYTGFTGIHPSGAADVDCDGLDELVMDFPPTKRVWEWDVGAGQFVEGCSYEASEYGTIINWYGLDLNQDGVEEFGSVNHQEIFRAFPGADCIFCDTTGACDPDGITCYCYCPSDPQCDHVTNVLDVVRSVEVAFRSASPIADPHEKCPCDLTDANCDGKTDVLDVVHFVNVAFRSGDPLIEFSHPCAP